MAWTDGTFSLSQAGTVTQNAKLKMTTPTTSQGRGPTSATRDGAGLVTKYARNCSVNATNNTKLIFCASMFSCNVKKPSGPNVRKQNA